MGLLASPALKVSEKGLAVRWQWCVDHPLTLSLVTLKLFEQVILVLEHFPITEKTFGIRYNHCK